MNLECFWKIFLTNRVPDVIVKYTLFEMNKNICLTGSVLNHPRDPHVYHLRANTINQSLHKI